MSDSQRELALEVVRKLHTAGYSALWAGGCVRDQLLQLPPKDYDIATSARPEEIRALFGHKRTLAIGAAFGVVTVLGARIAGKTCQIDVATFRSDGAYLDGRRPESVVFGSAELDAQRRDFSINGMFYDPVNDTIIDYVGGRTDLQNRMLRAIGNPLERFREDKLRLLRAIRFAASYQLTIESATRAAIEELAGEITVVSAERIAAEMRRMLVHHQRAQAVEWLDRTGLLQSILPEAVQRNLSDGWKPMMAMLLNLGETTFPASLAVLLRTAFARDSSIVARVGSRWKLASVEIGATEFFLREEALIRSALAAPWPRLQRVLIHPQAAELLNYAQAIAWELDGNATAIEFCRAKLALPAAQLNPPPLITGNDLKPLGIEPGPQFRELLNQVRDAQLLGDVTDRAAALEFVRNRQQQMRS